jgi:NADPH:quinone reductase-like Zn-dependent oxidoreductase
MDVIPTAVCLTTYQGEAEDFIVTPLDKLIQQVVSGPLHVQIGAVFQFDDIVEAHCRMENNRANGEIVVLT